VGDYRRCVELSGVRDVMLGRGILANPALALMIKSGEGAFLALARRTQFVIRLLGIDRSTHHPTKPVRAG